MDFFLTLGVIIGKFMADITKHNPQHRHQNWDIMSRKLFFLQDTDVKFLSKQKTPIFSFYDNLARSARGTYTS